MQGMAEDVNPDDCYQSVRVAIDFVSLDFDSINVFVSSA